MASIKEIQEAIDNNTFDPSKYNSKQRRAIDAAIQKGNSGGPILNRFGNVVGVAVAKADVEYFMKKFDSIPENINFGVKSSVVLNLLSGNGIEIQLPNTEELSTKVLGKQISSATLYLSCGMTVAQIEKLRTKKVLFKEFE